MSRIGLKPIPIPQGVEIKMDGTVITVKGPKGTLTREFHRDMSFNLEGDKITVVRPSDNKLHKSLHGLSRSLLFNMVDGVSNGFRKTLEINGVGYRAQMQGDKLVMQMGFSHPVEFEKIAGIDFVVEANKIIVHGISKEQVGQIAAVVRNVRPVEPYKGKGIRYEGEHVIRKVGKSGKK